MRTLNSRRGVSAMELLLVLVLFTGVVAAVYAVMRMVATETTAAVQRAAASRDQVALWALLHHDLAHAILADVTVIGTNAVEFDRPVGEGPACANEPFAVLIRSAHAWLSRQPEPGRDHLQVREPGMAGGWSRRGIVSVAVANCPDGGTALRLATDAAITATAFARIVEPVRLRSYGSAGAHALGLEGRLGGGPIQPFAGPVDPTAFQSVLSGDLLAINLSRFPLVPMQLNLPLSAPP